MRIFKIGSIRSSGFMGICVLLVDLMNPITQISKALEPILWLRKSGNLRSLRLPMIKILWLKKNKQFGKSTDNEIKQVFK